MLLRAELLLKTPDFTEALLADVVGPGLHLSDLGVEAGKFSSRDGNPVSDIVLIRSSANQSHLPLDFQKFSIDGFALWLLTCIDQAVISVAQKLVITLRPLQCLLCVSQLHDSRVEHLTHLIRVGRFLR